MGRVLCRQYRLRPLAVACALGEIGGQEVTGILAVMQKRYADRSIAVTGEIDIALSNCDLR